MRESMFDQETADRLNTEDIHYLDYLVIEGGFVPLLINDGQIVGCEQKY